MYYTIYDLLNTCLVNGEAVAGTAIGDSITFVAVVLTLSVFYIPFKVCWNTIDLITRWR